MALFALGPLPPPRPTPKVDWKKKDGSLAETSGVLENFQRSLFFNSITQSDDGEYECKASNSNGVITHSFTVTVEGRNTQGTYSGNRTR